MDEPLNHPSKSIDVFPVSPQLSYANDLDTPALQNDFIGNGFEIALVEGFSTAAIHSAHPYGMANDFIYTLTTPIIVGSSDAVLTYDDVVLVEEGVSILWTDGGFFDYVVVEGTKDGINWGGPGAGI